ncbi:MAG: translation elongation factor Ts [Phycisphaerae bacterium]|jgi:elongation factor Ts
MATITAQMVKDLREKTDLPMMECKQALTECDGSVDAALEWLRKKHKGKMAERADRTTGEGRIGVFLNDTRTVGALVELQCETAPVAKNELFVDLANAIARTVASGSQQEPDPESVRQDAEVDAKFTDVYGRLRETMNLKRCRRVEGTHLASYIHHDGKSGVLLALDAEPKSDKAVAADLCMHTIFTDPVAIDRSGVPTDQVEKVRAEAVEVAKAEGKPEQIIEKIATGKVNAFFSERVLMEQLHVKTDDYGKKARIGDVLKQAGVNAITDLSIMKIGA